MADQYQLRRTGGGQHLIDAVGQERYHVVEMAEGRGQSDGRHRVTSGLQPGSLHPPDAATAAITVDQQQGQGEGVSLSGAISQRSNGSNQVKVSR